MSDERAGREAAAKAILLERERLMAEGMSDSLAHLMLHCARVAVGQ